MHSCTRFDGRIFRDLLCAATLAGIAAACSIARPAGPATTKAARSTPTPTPTSTPTPAPTSTATATGATAEEEEARAIARVSDIDVLALPAPGFSQLPREQRLLAFWLAQAANAGDAIAWDQAYRHNLEVVRLLRGILAHPQAVLPGTLDRVRKYARLLYVQHGLHDPDTERKAAPPPFTPAELRLAALAAQAAGEDFDLGPGASLERHLRSFEATLFDPAVDGVRSDRSPSAGKDPLLSSALNEYSGVSLKELQGFHDRYPRNSRLIKAGGKLVEQVYRAGSPAVPAGLYPDRLERVIRALEQALPLARGAQARSLEHLIAYFRTGDPELFRLSQRDWLEEAPPVDYVLGFIETAPDPRGVKGLWEGFVGYQDLARTEALERLTANAQYFREQVPPPWADQRAPLRERASALFVLAGSGANRPQRSTLTSLPSDPAERAVVGSKTFLLAAAADAIAQARSNRILREFAPPGMGDALVRCRSQLELALVAFREVVWRASGISAPRLSQPGRDPTESSQANALALKEARADLAGHLLIADRKAREIGLVPDARCQELSPQYSTALLLASAAAPGDEEGRRRAALVLLGWFSAKGAVAEHKAQGRTTFAPIDALTWRAAAKELLALLREIEASGDGVRLRALVEETAARLEPRWPDEARLRIEKLSLPRRAVALAPALRPVMADGHVVDAVASPVEDLDAQILSDWASF